MSVTRRQALRVALIAFGAVCTMLGPLMLVWPSGWRWVPHQSHYEQMMVGLYLTLGVFVIRAARAPMKHQSLIWFAIWSSVVHAAIMTAQALTDPEHYGHLVADVPALFAGAGVLAFLMMSEARADVTSAV